MGGNTHVKKDVIEHYREIHSIASTVCVCVCV